MNYSAITGLYEVEIPGQQLNAFVKYKIMAYDFAGNKAEQDNSGSYFVYTVVPEFSTIFALLALLGLASLAVLAIKKKMTF